MPSLSVSSPTVSPVGVVARACSSRRTRVGSARQANQLAYVCADPLDSVRACGVTAGRARAGLSHGTGRRETAVRAAQPEENRGSRRLAAFVELGAHHVVGSRDLHRRGVQEARGAIVL